MIIDECNGDLVSKSVIEYGDKIPLLWIFFSWPEFHINYKFSPYFSPHFLFKIMVSIITNFTMFTNISLHRIVKRWSTKNQDKCWRSGEIADLLVAGILTLLIFKSFHVVFTLYMFKMSANYTIVLRHNMISWCSWWTQSCIAKSLDSCENKGWSWSLWQILGLFSTMALYMSS